MGFRVKGLGIAIVFAVSAALGVIVGNAADAETDFEAQEKEAQEKEEQTLCYEIRNQVLESGKRLCDLEAPEYAIAADGTRVDGKIVWYFPETGTVLDEKMTITGESGEQYIFGWRFIPAEVYQEYEPVAGQVEVTICVTGQKVNSGTTDQSNNGEDTNPGEHNGAANQAGNDAGENPEQTNAAVNQDGSISSFSRNEGNNSVESDSSQAEDTAEKETGNNSAESETQRLWDALVWAMAQNTGESETETAADSANVSGHFFGSSTVTVVPDGIDPSSLMGSITTGIWALGKIVSKATGTAGTAETESSFTKTQKDTAEAGTSQAERQEDASGAGTSRVETQETTAGTETGQEETQKETSGTGKNLAETDKDTAETGKNLAETDSDPAETQASQTETDTEIAGTDEKLSGTNLSVVESDRDSTESDSAQTGGEASSAKEDSAVMTLFKRRAAVLAIWFILGTNRFFL